MSLSDNFLGEVQIFVTDLGITESVLGSRAVGDSGVIVRLRRGQSITLRTADRITAYMAAERLRRAEAALRGAMPPEILRAAAAGLIDPDGVPELVAGLSEAEAEDREAALESWAPGAPRWLARLLSRFAP